MKHATIFDIAQKLGISPSTVSRALNDNPNINKDTKKRVKQIAEEMDFFPNSIAKSLKNKSTTTIGVIVPDIKHDFFSSAISGIEEVAYNSGYSIIVCQSHDLLEREEINTNVLLNNRIAGILVSISRNTIDGDHFNKFEKRGVPLVFFDRALINYPASKVVVDDHNSAYRAVNYLIQKGYKKIAHIGGPQSLDIYKKRLSGYMQALADNGMVVNEELVPIGNVYEQDGYEAVSKFIQTNNIPDAIFTINDDVALGAINKLKEEKLRIPEDVAVIGFSNTRISSIAHPSITTVEQPSLEMGKKAAEILIQLIENKEQFENNTTIILDTELIIRESA
jgi:LacI family transcriptional regulator